MKVQMIHFINPERNKLENGFVVYDDAKSNFNAGIIEKSEVSDDEYLKAVKEFLAENKDIKFIAESQLDEAKEITNDLLLKLKQ